MAAGRPDVPAAATLASVIYGPEHPPQSTPSSYPITRLDDRRAGAIWIGSAPARSPSRSRCPCATCSAALPRHAVQHRLRSGRERNVHRRAVQSDSAPGARGHAGVRGPRLRRQGRVFRSSRCGPRPGCSRSAIWMCEGAGGGRPAPPADGPGDLTATVQSDFFGELDGWRGDAALAPRTRHVDRKAGVVQVTDFADPPRTGRHLHRDAARSRTRQVQPRRAVSRSR